MIILVGSPGLVTSKMLLIAPQWIRVPTTKPSISVPGLTW
jgi:hypothetical protein